MVLKGEKLKYNLRKAPLLIRQLSGCIYYSTSLGGDKTEVSAGNE